MLAYTLGAIAMASLAAAQASSASAAASSTLATVSFPGSKPTSAVNVSPGFVGFGFETANFNNYTNIFAQNLIGSVAKRMAVNPTVRIGGTTG